MNKATKMITVEAAARHDEVNERLLTAAACKTGKVYKLLGSSEHGLTEEAAKEARELYGDNTVTYGKDNTILHRLKEAFINPFTLILIALAIVSVFTDIVLVAPGKKDYATVIIITTMVLIAGILRFIQETRSGNAAGRLQEMIETTASVERVETGLKEIPLDEIVVGDLIHLSAGDMIPADLRILQAKDLFISQSALTGES